MDKDPDKSLCDNLSDESRVDVTPPSYITARSRTVTADDLNKFKEEMKDMIHNLFLAHKKELNNISPTLQEIRQTNSNIEGSIALLSAQNAELTKKITSLENKIKEDKECIRILEDKLENLQIGWRKTNFEIKNVPKKHGETKEDLVEMTLCLSSNVGGNLNKGDIKDIYRVRGKKDTQNSTIIVETSSTILKNYMLKLCKNFNVKSKAKLSAKHLGFRTSEDTPVFVTEQLTAKASRLYFLARDLAKSGQYKFCWTSYGKVYIRKTETSPIIQIKSEAQVHQLVCRD